MPKQVNRKICLSGASKGSVAVPFVDQFGFISMSGHYLSDKAITIDLMISSSNGFAKLLMRLQNLHLASYIRRKYREAICQYVCLDFSIMSFH